MAVLNPLKVIIKNWPAGKTEELEAINNPNDESAGTRLIPFSGELYIDRDDFMEDPPRKFFRLSPGREVRLRYAYYITCEEVIKDDSGKLVELICTYDPETRGGSSPDGRKIKGTIHWVSADHSKNAEIRLYDHLFSQQNPGQDKSILDDLNASSLKILTDCRVEPELMNTRPGDIAQFERKGYFCTDLDSTPEKPVFNRTISLRDDWAKIQKQNKEN
jgi:glutaminyl-tRNA synthetase